MIKTIPPNQDKLKGTFLAILFPKRHPKIIAIMLAPNENENSASPFTPASAAPIPTAKPSRDNEIASAVASPGESIFEESISASSGLEYRLIINLKFKSESLISLLILLYFLTIDFVMLSNNFTRPSINRIMKHKAIVTQVGIKSVSVVPIKKPLPVTTLHRVEITITEGRGILILLLP